MKHNPSQEYCVNHRASDIYKSKAEPLVAAEKLTRRGFLRKSGTAGVALGVVGLAPFATAQSGSASGSGDYLVVCIGDPGSDNRVLSKAGEQLQNDRIPGNYQWQRVDSADFDDPGLGPEDTLSLSVSASGPRKGAKGTALKITGVASADYIEDDLFTGIVSSTVAAKAEQSVQLGVPSSAKARPPLTFVHNPETDHGYSKTRSTLQVRVDISGGTVLGTATDSGGPIIDWKIDAGTGGANLSLTAPESQKQNPETRTGSFTWTFAVLTQAEYLKWCQANSIKPQ